QRRHRLTYLFISHDLRVVRALADEILVMRDGVVVEHGPAAHIFTAPKDPYTRALMAAAFDLTAVDSIVEAPPREPPGANDTTLVGGSTPRARPAGDSTPTARRPRRRRPAESGPTRRASAPPSFHTPAFPRVGRDRPLFRHPRGWRPRGGGDRL